MPNARPAVGVAIVLVALALPGCGGSEESASTATSSRPAAQRPIAVSLDRLRSFAETIGHPVYWAGPRSGGYELTVDVNGNIFIRYLEGNVQPGSRRRTSLTVATYLFANAYRVLRAASRVPGATVDHTPDGGLAVIRPGSSLNAYIAYPERDVQIEVYDPRAGRALALATTGAITPIR